MKLVSLEISMNRLEFWNKNGRKSLPWFYVKSVFWWWIDISDIPGRGWWYGGGGGMMLNEAVVWVDADPSGVPTDPTPGGLVVDRQVWQRGPGREITWVGPFQGIHSHLVTNAPWSAHIWNLSLTRSGCARRSCASGISESTMPVKNQILRVVTHKVAWCFSAISKGIIFCCKKQALQEFLLDRYISKFLGREKNCG